MEQQGQFPQQGISAELRPLQQQTQRHSLTHCGRNIVAMLAMSAPELCEYLRREAERNPCVELTFPQAHRMEYIESRAAAKADVSGELVLQLPAGSDPEALKLARGLIGYLDPYGFLPFDPVKRCPEERRRAMRAAVRLVQSLEPAGVGARSLRECYYLQAKRCAGPRGDACLLLKSAALFRLYVSGALDEVCAKLGWERERLDAVTRTLSGFSMRPLEAGEESASYITPDAQIVRAESDGYTARLFEHALPHVSLSTAYIQSPGGGGRFANEGVYYANRLIYCLERRNAALLSVLEYAAQRQSAFLDGGHKARLTMSETAAALGLGLSSVSRAVAGKYVLFEGRVMAADTLFSRAGKNGLSREEALHLIGGLIDAGAGERPLSDRAICELLKERYGITLSRRTVGKYRAMLGLPPSTERDRV